MSILDLYNTFQLEDSRTDAANDRRIMELGQQAEYLQRSTGNRPDSWYEFKMKHEEKLKLHTRRNALVGALTGAVLGMGVVLLVAAAIFSGLPSNLMSTLPVMQVGFAGAAIGGLIGWNSEVTRENKSNTALVNKYADYLDDLGQLQNVSVQQGVSNDMYRDDHVKKLQQQAVAQVNDTMRAK